MASPHAHEGGLVIDLTASPPRPPPGAVIDLTRDDDDDHDREEAVRGSHIVVIDDDDHDDDHDHDDGNRGDDEVVVVENTWSAALRQQLAALQSVRAQLRDMERVREMPPPVVPRRTVPLPQAPPAPVNRRSRKRLKLAKVVRQGLDGNSCPICFEDFVAGRTRGVHYCQYGCGANVHKTCMDKWKVARTRVGGRVGQVACVLCRTVWNGLKPMDED